MVLSIDHIECVRKKHEKHFLALCITKKSYFVIEYIRSLFLKLIFYDTSISG